MPEPVEIKLTINTTEVKRDLDRMKKRFAEMQPKGTAKLDDSKPFKTSLKSPESSPVGGTGGGGLGFGLDRPAFPSGVGTGSGRTSVELPKSVQKELGKLIDKEVPKIVDREAKSILPQLFKAFTKGGTGGVAKFAAGEALEAAGGAEGIAGAVGGEAAVGAVGAAGAVVTYAGVAALVAIGIKKSFDSLVTGGEYLSTILSAISDKFEKQYPGIKDAVAKANEQTAELEKIKATLDTLLSSAKRTVGLEESRLFLGGDTQAASDFARIHDLQVRKQRETDAAERQTRNEVARNLVKQIVAGSVK